MLRGDDASGHEVSLVTAVTEKATDNRDYNYSFQQIFLRPSVYDCTTGVNFAQLAILNHKLSLRRLIADCPDNPGRLYHTSDSSKPSQTVCDMRAIKG